MEPKLQREGRELPDLPFEIIEVGAVKLNENLEPVSESLASCAHSSILRWIIACVHSQRSSETA